MRFYMPADTYIEKNCVENHSKDILKFGQKALIVTGRHSARKNGSLDDILKVLEEGDVSYKIFDEVEENPSVETVVKAAVEGKTFGADFVIGIGGGSPLDASKAIALLIANPDETAQCLYENRTLGHLPVVAVPTTCGTGSEVTGVSVLTRHDLGTKQSIPYRIYPSLALIDGKYILGAGRNLLANTSTDALAHCIEAYLNSKADVLNRMFSSYGISLWKTVIPILTGQKEIDEESAELLMTISMIGGLAVGQCASSLPHGMSYEVTYNKGIPHGKACGIFQAAYMRQYEKHCPEDIRAILDALDMKDLDELDTLITSMFGKPELSREEADAYIDNMLANPRKLSSFPFPMGKKEFQEIYSQSLTLIG